ncbi:hypothetical protein [Syntrophus aciditrophicus]|uniref:Hypothetical cytosolic protein n=1 Tax=Syntrophus aciditrophicus (strain SB) TaxID=56780 RepID=Q2LTC5_SYNAS|nr:hypothetical protein [Syntrophus aciditrophicus]ABC77335.1 hypothetical cytosolic protein [Syntrophus aciditrophicus SB]OPY17813.1 MAG: hypothetical protein A4E74_00997 [Syntrophus sp. PtaB.Bin075]
MGKKSRSGKKEDTVLKENIRLSIYVPEEQLFQRIPLCRYLSDLSSFFENEDDEKRFMDSSGEKKQP